MFFICICPFCHFKRVTCSILMPCQKHLRVSWGFVVVVVIYNFDGKSVMSICSVVLLWFLYYERVCLCVR